ncbi:hypothetical protein A2U01_0102549, partial [Trifolium medium]|nr:hypothetical protein [Trifolium medium]
DRKMVQQEQLAAALSPEKFVISVTEMVTAAERILDDG